MYLVTVVCVYNFFKACRVCAQTRKQCHTMYVILAPCSRLNLCDACVKQLFNSGVVCLWKLLCLTRYYTMGDIVPVQKDTKKATFETICTNFNMADVVLQLIM